MRVTNQDTIKKQTKRQQRMQVIMPIMKKQIEIDDGY